MSEELDRLLVYLRLERAPELAIKDAEHLQSQLTDLREKLRVAEDRIDRLSKDLKINEDLNVVQNQALINETYRREQAEKALPTHNPIAERALEELISILREYLSYPSLDGRTKRQSLREKMSAILSEIGPSKGREEK